MVRADRQLRRSMIVGAARAIAILGITCPILDFVLIQLVDQPLLRVSVRWSVLTVMALIVTVAYTRRTVRLVNQAAQQEATKKAAIIAQMGDGLLVCDRHGDVLEWNAAAAHFLGVKNTDLHSLAGDVPWQVFSADGERVSRTRDPLVRAVAGETVVGEYRILTDGHEQWVWAVASPLRNVDGSLNGGILVMRDIQTQRQANQAIRESEERYRRLVEWCPDPIVVHCDGEIVFANTACVALAGVATADELIGRAITDFVPVERRELLREHTRKTIEHGETRRLSHGQIVRADGQVIQIESTTMLVTFEGRPAIQAVIRDITERKRAEAALAYQALHDSLTGLPNRVLLMDRLQQAIAAGHREGRPVSLLLMDLDRFKEVNDALGHQAGDLLLQELGARLLSALRRGTDTISRLGGDEFAIILPGTDAEGALGVVDSLLQQLQAPFVIEGQPVIVGASIGVAVSPDHGEEADELLRRADVAMYVAKRTSSGCSMYRFEQDRNSPDRLLLISELRRAIDRDQLVLHYQPTIDLQTGELASVEALVRWQHPQRGLLSPDEFVPIAEQVALIESLSQWVLRTALAQLSAWRSAGFEVSVAVNLSMRSLQDERLPEKIAELLELAEVPSSLLILEITESTLMQDPARTLTIIEKLRRMGIRIAIDDFGTGHSSLAYLKRLTVDEVKIDRAFVRDIATDATDRLIVSSTIDLAHSLGLCVVGEGIEDRVTAALLAELGCDQAQGFYLSPPLWGDEIVPWERCRQNNALPLRLAA